MPWSADLAASLQVEHDPPGPAAGLIPRLHLRCASSYRQMFMPVVDEFERFFNARIRFST